MGSAHAMISAAARLVPVLLLAAVLGGCRGEVRHGPGVLAPNAPVQTARGEVPLLRHGGYLVEPLARFEVEARVLAAKRYRKGREAELSPVDLALGWGPMSDEAVLDHLEIWQNRRFYFWQGRILPIPKREISRHSANMHLIPATDEVREALLKVRPGEIVRFSGYLVQIRADDGWYWRSSLTRNDVGGGACEVVWVEYLVSFEPYDV